MREGGSKNYDGKRFPTVLGCLGLRAVFPGYRTFRTKNEKALGRPGQDGHPSWEATRLNIEGRWGFFGWGAAFGVKTF